MLNNTGQSSKSNLSDSYRGAAENYFLLEAKEERLLLRLSLARLFSVAGGLAICWIAFSVSKLAGCLFLLLLIIWFIYLLKLYSDHTRKKEFFRNLAKINSDESVAITGDYSLFEAGKAYIDISHDFSSDVDLFGGSSLFQYLNRTVTGYGRDILGDWLSDPFVLSSNLYSRQETIKELAGKDRWRHEFMASCMKTPLEKISINELLVWMKESNSDKFFPVANVLIWVLPAAALLSLFLIFTGFLHYSVFIVIFLINLFWIGAGLKKTNRIHSVLSGKYSYLSSMNELLKAFEKEPFDTSVLNDIKLNLACNNVSAAVSVRRLGRLLQSFDSRLNIMAGFFLNGLLLWDYHCISRLEKWKSEYREHFPKWLEMLGCVDAFISLGNYAYNNPDYTYPGISENGMVFEATGLGHPLIPDGKRITNDFVLGRRGTVCIISGANMAGKSTFLRTVAVSYILAMAGAPVCATGMSFTPSELFTSMRTTDSLSDNESYFYAELKKLKKLKAKIENGNPLFFILDEILKGTNSADKSLGSKLFLNKLIELGGTGLIASHDTSLGELEKDFPESVFNMCFEIEIEGETIRFEYKLHKGITQKMNAALLMKQMGILD